MASAIERAQAGKGLTVLTDVQGGAAWTSLQRWKKGGEKPNSGLCQCGEIPSCSMGKGAEGAEGTAVITRTMLGQRSGDGGEALLQSLSPLPAP